MKKYLKYILILIVLMGLFGLAEQAGAQTPATSEYQLLSPLPCELGKDVDCTPGERGGGSIKTFDTGGGLSKYLNLMITIFIGLAAVLSVVMIVVGGIEYMTSELVHSKEAGKERIRNALLGLVIALGAYALLFTINPQLLKSDIDLPLVKRTITLPATWYFEYQSGVTAGNYIMGPYYETECKEKSKTITGSIVRECFESATAPELTKDWYFQYQITLAGVTNNFTRGPYSKDECETESAKISDPGVIVRNCSQSSTQPEETNWYFEYNSASERRNFVNGPFTQTLCLQRSAQIASPDTILMPCSPLDVRPNVTTWYLQYKDQSGETAFNGPFDTEASCNVEKSAKTLAIRLSGGDASTVSCFKSDTPPPEPIFGPPLPPQ